MQTLWTHGHNNIMSMDKSMDRGDDKDVLMGLPQNYDDNEQAQKEHC